MANKFYYNGELVRTSKNHIYTHAAININTGTCLGCSSTIQGAQKVINDRKSAAQEEIGNAKAAISALKSGKNGYYAKAGRHTYFHRFDENDTIEKYQGWIDHDTNRIEYIDANLRVVELEMR